MGKRILCHLCASNKRWILEGSPTNWWMGRTWCCCESGLHATVNFADVCPSLSIHPTLLVFTFNPHNPKQPTDRRGLRYLLHRRDDRQEEHCRLQAQGLGLGLGLKRV
jgi:hypothetical protein